MTDRDRTLALLRIAGFHGDQRTWMRTYTSRRISYLVARKAWADGQRARAAGAGCSCYECVATAVAS